MSVSSEKFPDFLIKLREFISIRKAKTHPKNRKIWMRFSPVNEICLSENLKSAELSRHLFSDTGQLFDL